MTTNSSAAEKMILKDSEPQQRQKLVWKTWLALWQELHKGTAYSRMTTSFSEGKGRKIKYSGCYNMCFKY